MMSDLVDAWKDAAPFTFAKKTGWADNPEVQKFAHVNEIIRAIKGAEVVAPVRETLHGTREISVKDPGGHIVTFAQFVGAQH